MTKMDRMLTSKKAAKLLGCHPSVLTRRALAKKIPATRNGRGWLFWKSDVEKCKVRPRRSRRKRAQPERKPATKRVVVLLQDGDVFRRREIHPQVAVAVFGEWRV